MYKLMLFLLAIGVATADPKTPVKKCKVATTELFKSVTVKTPYGVCTNLPCNLYSGYDVKTDISFNIKKGVNKITVKCNATALGTTIDYPVKDAEKGCDMLTNVFCPIEYDTVADLTFQMNVSKIFPQIPVDLVIYLLDQTNKMISCFEVPTRVVAPK